MTDTESKSTPTPFEAWFWAHRYDRVHAHGQFLGDFVPGDIYDALSEANGVVVHKYWDGGQQRWVVDDD
jgi:hypothetical protein